MLRRWIIRSFFMVPILLCLGTWGWSRSHGMWIEYCHHDRYVASVSQWGTVEVQWGTSYGLAEGWACQISPEAIAHFWPVHSYTGSFLGFAYLREGTMPHTLHLLQAPYWFLIIVFSAILYVVWRKTRPRGTGRAFPVTLTAPRSDPSVKTQ